MYSKAKAIQALFIIANISYFISHCSAAPVIKYSSIHDIGMVNINISKPFTIPIKNVGDSDLVIGTVKKSCSCLQLQKYDHIIGPGKTGYIYFMLNLTKDIKSKGEIIVIRSNDPIHKDVQIELKYTYQPEILISPTYLDIQGRADKNALMNEAGSTQLTIRDLTGNLKIEKVYFSNPGLEFYMRDITVTRKSYENEHYFLINVLTSKGWPVGKICEYIYIKTNNEKHKQITIPIKGEILGPIMITPSFIVLKSGQGDFVIDATLASDQIIKIDKDKTRKSDAINNIEIIDNETNNVKIKIKGTKIDQPLPKPGEARRSQYADIVLSVEKPFGHDLWIPIYTTEQWLKGR
jgi:hypothetical protein